MKVYRKVHRASCQRTQEQRTHTPTPSRFISSSPLYPCKPAARSYVIRPKHKSDSVTWKEGDTCASADGENVFFSFLKLNVFCPTVINLKQGNGMERNTKICGMTTHRE